MKFEKYHIAEEIKRNLQKLNFRRPTDIQYKAIPSIMKGEDVLAIAQTGTGKTAAFAIPVIDFLHRRRQARRAEGVRCVVMVPTHELAEQITGVFDQIGHRTRVKALCITGGVDQQPQIDQLNKGVDVLVATPGRLFDLRSQGHLKLNRVEILILDEADHMLDLGFIKDIRDLMKYLPRKRQTLFFSATIDDKIKKLAYSLVTKPVRIQLSPKDPITQNVTHTVAFVEMDDKRFFLERLVNENPDRKVMVFVRTKVRAERVCKAMARVGIEAQTIHGDKEHKSRKETMDKFRKGELKLLIATDVSARGVDVASVEYVVNYDLPEQPENYVHRIGRTGRGTHRGNAVSFCSTDERPILKAIEEYLGQPIKVMKISKDAYEETKDMTEDSAVNWKELLKEEMAKADKYKQKKKRKKK